MSNLADNVPCISGQAFANILLTELPVYVQEVLRDVRPTDMFAAHVSSGIWNPFSGVQQTQDRLTHVYPNTTAAWQDVSEESCSGTPCDPPMNEICWGWKRVTFGQQIQSWKSPLLCFDQMISATKARENIEYYVSGILRPATAAITSMYVRQKGLELAGRKLLANSTMSSFTYTWEQDGNSQIFLTPSALPTSKLTPEMIKRQIPYLRNIGYFGSWTNDPFWGGYNQFAELVTDDDTAWEMDRMATSPRVAEAWRYTMWDAAHEYSRYGMGGQIGNYMVRIDPFSLRFNLNTNAPGGTSKLQLVLPYRNDAAVTAGLGDTVNEDYLNARYQISFIWHRFSWELLYQQLESINPMMPFLNRDLTGQWQFAMDNLGQDCDGNAINNIRRNKGLFYADWRLAGRPRYTEFLTAILHQREPQVIAVVPACAADPGYPTQSYQSNCDGCEGTLTWFSPQTNTEGSYELLANSTTCSGEPLQNAAIEEPNLTDLATALNADTALGALGTWAVTDGRLTLADATCVPALPWVTT
jgi:hypothetical protein